MASTQKFQRIFPNPKEHMASKDSVVKQLKVLGEYTSRQGSKLWGKRYGLAAEVIEKSKFPPHFSESTDAQIESLCTEIKKEIEKTDKKSLQAKEDKFISKDIYNLINGDSLKNLIGDLTFKRKIIHL